MAKRSQALNLEKTKCMLIGSNGKLETGKVVLTVTITMQIMSTASDTLGFLYHVILHGQIMLNTLLAKLIKGLVS